jgi:1,4-alpha-glucan branching enzyme
MHNTIRTLTALKHAVPALHDKTPVNWVTLSPANSNVLAYTRKEGDSEILVVLNMATEASTATLTGLTAGDWSLWLNSETIAQGTSRQQQTFSATQTISLEAKGYRVYVKGTFSEEGLPATSVNTLILNRPHDNRTYSLAGQPMQPRRPGIYIQNGKKFYTFRFTQ